MINHTTIKYILAILLLAKSIQANQRPTPLHLKTLKNKYCLPGCQACNSEKTVCQECAPNFFASSVNKQNSHHTCEECPKNCRECQDAKTCKKCEFFFKASKGGNGCELRIYMGIAYIVGVLVVFGICCLVMSKDRSRGYSGLD